MMYCTLNGKPGHYRAPYTHTFTRLGQQQTFVYTADFYATKEWFSHPTYSINIVEKQPKHKSFQIQIMSGKP